MTGIQRLLEAGLILVSAISIFLLTALLTFDPADPGWSQAGYTQTIQTAAGPIGAWFADVILFVFGVTAFSIPFFLMLAGYFVFYRPRELTEIDFLTLGLRLVGVVLVISGATGIFSIHLDPVYSFSAGGVFGDVLVDAMVPYFNVPGTLLLLITFILTGITLMTGLSWLRVVDSIGQGLIISALWLTKQVLKLRGEKSQHTLRDTRSVAKREPSALVNAFRERFSKVQSAFSFWRRKADNSDRNT